VTVSYREETPPGWSRAVQQTWQVEEVQRGVRLSGACPTCGHTSESLVVEVTASTPGGQVDGSGRKASASNKVEPVLVVCDCGEEHDNRPAGRRGCGRAGYLNLVPDEH
jgi:hypothetical protein